MRTKVTISYNTKERNNVKKTIKTDFLKSVSGSGDCLLVEYYNKNENLESKYCNSVEFHH